MSPSSKYEDITPEQVFVEMGREFMYASSIKKYFNIDKMNELIDAGINEVGENRKDSFLEKYEQLKDKNLIWHYFGVIKIPPKLSTAFIDSIDYLHSLDSIDLANAINKTRKKPGKLKCFVQVNLSNNSNPQILCIAKDGIITPF